MVSCVLVAPQLNFFLNRYKDYMPKGNVSMYESGREDHGSNVLPVASGAIAAV